MVATKSVLVVTYGRSGSTLLMGLLNSIDGYLIRGENANFFFSLYQAYKNLQETKTHTKAITTTNPWFGATVIPEKKILGSFSNTAKKFILADKLNNDSIRCYGFKEIRYALPEVRKDFDDYLAFLSDIFPDCRFIFNTRNLADVMKSKWWGKADEAKAKDKIIETEESFKNYAEKHPDNSFQITYEDVIAQNEKLQAMFEFLGEKYNKQSVDEVLNIRHSY